MAVRLGRDVPWALEKNSELLPASFGWIRPLLQLKIQHERLISCFVSPVISVSRIIISQCLNFQL